ncbi:hypothetical protein ACJX0J_039521, partial [Zea mays]
KGRRRFEYHTSQKKGVTNVRSNTEDLKLTSPICFLASALAISFHIHGPLNFIALFLNFFAYIDCFLSLHGNISSATPLGSKAAIIFFYRTSNYCFDVWFQYLGAGANTLLASSFKKAPENYYLIILRLFVTSKSLGLTFAKRAEH